MDLTLVTTVADAVAGISYPNILMMLAIIFGFYMAWNIGANDVANAMATSVGSGALPLRRGSKGAVVGPQANGHGLLSDYFPASPCSCACGIC